LKKNFWVILVFFSNPLNAYAKKNGTFLDILQAVFTYCFATEIPKKYKIEAPLLNTVEGL
jgi:hypothetical protein